MVPFLHVMSRIEGRPYDDLLIQKGGLAFPTVMFLDADGKKLVVHAGPQSVPAFERSLEVAEKVVALEEKAAGGDAHAAAELLVHALTMDWYGYEEAQAKAAALSDVTPEQRARIDQLLVDAEVRSLLVAAREDREKQAQLGRRFLDMWREGRVPANEAQAYAFWILLANHADGERDRELFGKIVEEFRKSLGGNRRYRAALQSLQQRLASFPPR